MIYHSKVLNRIYIVGAGDTGIAIAREIQSKGVIGSVVAFLDDDTAKIGRTLLGVPVLGPIVAVIDLLKTTPADEAIIALPRSTPEQIHHIYRLLQQGSFSHIRIVPGISQVLEDRAHLVQTREINPEDLLSRTPVSINLRETLTYLRGKRVFITGAGGSIGSELSRQLLSGGPERLYLFGHGESSIYEIEHELRVLQAEGVGEATTVVPVIGELQDSDFMKFILHRTRSNVVFHTAAHKHVPLMEENPIEAVKNNVYGTMNIVKASVSTEVERFVLISTDKAVEPICIYGASKLLAEEIVLNQAIELKENSLSKFLVVRFGNVLGSRGSFMPLFRKQILSGGPVTLTHSDVRRYLMTIPEAVSLVLQAGGSGNGGELYLLDMGKPQLIKKVAEQMIRFYGYEPEKDIKFFYTDLRKGDKLVENLWQKGDRIEKTEHEKILKLTRAYSMSRTLNNLLKCMEPVCFYSPATSKLFRNRHYLKETLCKAIPTLKSIQNEPDY